MMGGGEGGYPINYQPYGDALPERGTFLAIGI